MIKIYQKQPIQAEQFDGSQKYVFGHKVMSEDSLVDALTHDPVYCSILINEGDPGEEPNEVVFEIGDWIIKDGEDIHVISDDVFDNKYAELPVIPNAIAEWIEYCKTQGLNLEDAIDDFVNPVKAKKWLDENSLEPFARAWLDGYQLEAQHDTRTD